MSLKGFVTYLSNFWRNLFGRICKDFKFLDSSIVCYNEYEQKKIIEAILQNLRGDAKKVTPMNQVSGIDDPNYVQQVMKETELEERMKKDVKELLTLIMKNKANHKTAHDFLPLTPQEILKGELPIREVWTKFEEEKKKNNAIDFIDMLVVFYERFNEDKNKDSLEMLRQRSLFIFVVLFRLLIFLS